MLRTSTQVRRPTRAPRWVALGIVVSVLATACGTRVDPAQYQLALDRQAADATPGAASVATSRDATVPLRDGQTPLDRPVATTPPGPSTTGERTQVSSSGPPPSSNVAPPADTPAAPGTTGQPPAPGAPPPTEPPTTDAQLARLSDEVVGETIRIGMHVPITGAAPMPTDWSKYLDALMQYVNDELVPHGRRVEIRIEDDGYDPSQAMAACRRLAEDDPLFVIGMTMPAAQDTCAGYFDGQDIPYLMRGTTPTVLDGRPFAFFATTPDDVQGRLLADYVVKNLDAANRAVGIIYHNDQMAARDEFTARLAEHGIEVPVTIEGTPRQSDYNSAIQKLRGADVDLVFLSLPPVDVIKLSVQSNSQGYNPTWLGGASYWNYNMTLESAGTALDGAISFSPWPSIDSAASDEFKQVYARYQPNDDPEDIGLIIWGWTMMIAAIIEDAGEDLSRRSVVEAVRGLELNRADWNPLSYPRLGNRGGDAVAVFRADGQAKRWRQVAGFSTEF